MGSSASADSGSDTHPLLADIALDSAWNTITTALRHCDAPNGQQNSTNPSVLKHSGWKTVRIFVSSTFRDFHQEREILIKKVFPDLRLWCQKRRLHLVESDLRWGAPKDYSEAQALSVCLEEIDRCYKENVMPFFVNMTSERVGWVPLGDQVPESIRGEYKWIDLLSDAEKKTMHAAYRSDNPNAMFTLRDPSFLADVPEQHKSVFIDSNEVAPYQLRLFKKMISDTFPEERVIRYRCSYSGYNEKTGTLGLDGLEDEFSNAVVEFFKKRIRMQYPLDDASRDPYELQRNAHEAFMKQRSADLVGRDTVMKEIESFLLAPPVDAPLVLVGGAGSGKSSLMARVADMISTLEIHGKLPQVNEKDWHVFYHFVGAVPGSTDLFLAIKRLLKELEYVDESHMPKDLDTAVQLCSGALSSSNIRPVIVIVDALNQFDDENAARNVNWVPRKLASQVRCIFSMIHDTPQHKVLTGREPPARELRLTPLDMSERKEIVKNYLGKFNKSLDEEQMRILLGKESSENPLWLSIACEELRVNGDFRKLTETIQSLQDGLFDLEKQVMDRLRAENGGELLVAAMSLLEVANRGLLEKELLQLLGDEDNLFPSTEDGEEKKDSGKEKTSEMLPSYRWADVYRGLHVFLRPFGDSGEGRLDFYHRSISKAVRQKYFDEIEENNNVGDQRLPFSCGEEAYIWWHRKLADFFEEEENLERKLEEYPFHLTALGDHKRLKDFLVQWDVVEALYDVEYSSRLLNIWHKACIASTEMEQAYIETIENFKNSPQVDQNELSLRYEKTSRILTQEGRFTAAMRLAEAAMEIEKQSARPERLAELYHLLGFIGDEEMRLEEYMLRTHLPRIRVIIDNLSKSIEYRKQFDTAEHKRKMGRALNRLAFYYSGWAGRGGDSTMDATTAKDLAIKAVDESIEVFSELGDEVFKADATTTKGVCYLRPCPEQIQCYKEACECLLRSIGENHVLVERLYLNMGIYYEEAGDTNQAYTYFRKWYLVCCNIFGDKHPRTKRSISTLNEATYKQIAAMCGDPVPDVTE